ncbi:hypothetical protein A2U01_0094693, partial [Trifolium medium]|nr:hypothetical protein [Trifolium medium]
MAGPERGLQAKLGARRAYLDSKAPQNSFQTKMAITRSILVRSRRAIRQ